LEDLAGLWCNLVDTAILFSQVHKNAACATYPLIRTTKTSFSSAGM
jgi:hypothetical protein